MTDSTACPHNKPNGLPGSDCIRCYCTALSNGKYRVIVTHGQYWDLCPLLKKNRPKE